MRSNQPRYGQPRTDIERAARHKELYGTEKLPPRGSGYGGNGGNPGARNWMPWILIGLGVIMLVKEK